MSLHSMTEVAYQIMVELEAPMSFAELWEKVKTEMGFNEAQAAKKIASFYSALMLDKKFVLLEDNIWDLRKRHTYHETHIDLSEIEIAEDLINDEDFDRELELEYLDSND